jgi:hypothetical protein
MEHVRPTGVSILASVVSNQNSGTVSPTMCKNNVLPNIAVLTEVPCPNLR